MSTLVSTTVQTTTLKKDASTTNATLNANGTMTMGNAVKTGQQWNSSFKVGILDNTYAAFSSFMDESHATHCYTGIHLISPRVVYISWYFYRNAHFGTWNNTYGWGIQLPSDIVPIGGSNFGYQSLPAQYLGFNGTNYFNASPHRWQSNNKNDGSNHSILSLYGSQGATNWTSGGFETCACGTLVLANDVTTAYA